MFLWEVLINFLGKNGIWWEIYREKDEGLDESYLHAVQEAGAAAAEEDFKAEQVTWTPFLEEEQKVLVDPVQVTGHAERWLGKAKLPI